MEKTFYSEEQINDLKTSAAFYKLESDDFFKLATPGTLAKICNGCGPERWTTCKRRALTVALSRYEVCFAIHDTDYQLKNITQKEADKRLRRNMLKVWRRDFGLTRWFTHAGRAERLVVIPTVYAVVTIGGAEAWEEAGDYEDEQCNS